MGSVVREDAAQIKGVCAEKSKTIIIKIKLVGLSIVLISIAGPNNIIYILSVYQKYDRLWLTAHISDSIAYELVRTVPIAVGTVSWFGLNTDTMFLNLSPRGLRVTYIPWVLIIIIIRCVCICLMQWNQDVLDILSQCQYYVPCSIVLAILSQCHNVDASFILSSYHHCVLSQSCSIKMCYHPVTICPLLHEHVLVFLAC